MRVSQFEIYRLAQRALEGSGAPYGVDRDGARAVAWLEARGLPGLARLDSDLPGLAGHFGGLALRDDRMVEAAGISALAYAGAVLDLWRGESAGKDGRPLVIRACRSQIFLLAVAAAGRDAQGLVLRWTVAGAEIRCRVAPAGEAWLSVCGGLGLAALGSADSADVEISADSDAPGVTADFLDPDELARRRDHALKQGIAVDEDLWRRIDAVAARVQVPASDASRLKGAGGGDANA